MKNSIAVVFILALFGFAAYAAGDNPAVGKWDCTSVSDETKAPTAWTLVVKEDGGKLSVTLTGDVGEAPVLDPKVEGNTFTFKVKVNENETVDVTTHIEGNKLDGTFKGKESGAGTFKGTKQA